MPDAGGCGLGLGCGLVAGVDEVGRGSLMGPVYAAAVILHENHPIVGLADSKKLSPKQRQILYAQICSQALCYSVAQASVEEIDRFNILQATLLAMQRAVMGLRLKPNLVLVDGNCAPQLNFKVQTIVRGDESVAAISAASIVAKVERDLWCTELDAQYPGYGFAQHKGYGTAMHLQQLSARGVTPWHRRSFKPVASNGLQKT